MARARSHGLLVFDKPAGITSRAVVNTVQRWFPRGTAVGHTGTLDPFATGVLVVCVGAATRLTEYVQDMPKSYRSVFLLGQRSDTDDITGRVESVPVARPPERERVATCLRGFQGEIQQTPPAFSAARVGGRRAYHLARKGQEVSLEARPVRVERFDLLAYDFPRLEVEVKCGKGTYIRSLARDLGEQLGCGGLVAELRRTRIGPFDPGLALPLDADPETARRSLLPLDAAVHGLPRVVLSAPELTRLRQGQTLPLPPATETTAPATVAVYSESARFAAIATADPFARTLRPEKVLPEE